MKYNYEGIMVDLPEWCKFWSEEERRESAKAIVEYKHDDYEFYQEALEEVCDENENLIRELKKDGFTQRQAEEVLFLYNMGHTLDSAMQTVIMNEEV